MQTGLKHFNLEAGIRGKGITLPKSGLAAFEKIVLLSFFTNVTNLKISVRHYLLVMISSFLPHPLSI